MLTATGAGSIRGASVFENCWSRSPPSRTPVGTGTAATGRRRWAARRGRKEIAGHLLAHGARIDLFAAATLGRREIVRAILTDDPEARRRPGPHGIPLMVHAKAGGEEARAVVDYLEALDAA
jgi:hypothetical protein